jgi:alpha/beta superfamily hydrolase
MWIEGPAGQLEASLRGADSPRAAVVLAHPHPLHGGTLDHPVLFHADRELNRAGCLTLRFNFRGVGASDGTHDGGTGERDDLAAAAHWIGNLAPRVPLLVVGYSFGSWCAIRHAAVEPRINGVVAIGLPARLYRFPELAGFGRPFAVVQGERDEFGSVAEVEALVAETVPPGRLLIVPDAEHLFRGHVTGAAAAVVEATTWVLSESPAP